MTWLLSPAGRVIALLAALTLSFGAGYWRAASGCEAEAYKAQLEASERARKDAQALIVALSEREAQVVEATRTIVREVPAAVADNRACDIGPEAVALLNRARAP